MNKVEQNLIAKLMEASIECKMEAYKMLGDNLAEIQKQIANLLGQPVEPKYVAPVVETKTNDEAAAENHALKEMNNMLEDRITELEKRLQQETKEETKQNTKEEKEMKKTKEIKQNHKVSDVKKLINCGTNEGKDEVLFIEKRRDSKHLWFGQVRISNEVRNFHWSNELDLPVVYGIESARELQICRTLIRTAVHMINPKEVTMFDEVPDHPDFGGFHGRQFLGALSQGGYIYLAPAAQDENGKDDDIIAKGYVSHHAFIVRRDGEVYWRHYNYVFMKKPFERTPSKGYDKEQMQKDVQILFDAVCDQYDKFASIYYRQNTLATKVETKETPVNNNKPNDEDIYNADVSGLFD